MRILMSLVLLSLASMGHANTQSVELVSPDGTNPYRAGGLEEVTVSLIYGIEPDSYVFGFGAAIFYSSESSTVNITNFSREELFGVGDFADSEDLDNDYLTDRVIRIAWSTDRGWTDGAPRVCKTCVLSRKAPPPPPPEETAEAKAKVKGKAKGKRRVKKRDCGCSASGSSGAAWLGLALAPALLLRRGRKDRGI